MKQHSQIIFVKCSYLLGESLGEYHKIEKLKTQDIYFGLSGYH